MISATPELASSRSQGILSDLDGTLYRNYDLQSDYERAFVAFVAQGLQVSQQRALEVISDWRKRLEILQGFPASEFGVLRASGLKVFDWLRYSEQVICPEIYLHPDMSMILAVAEVRKFSFFDVLTNTSRPLAERTLRAIGLEGNIDGLWTPDVNDFVGKPSPKLYARVAKMRNLPNSMVLVIGDRWHIDLVGVSELGMRGTLVNGPEQATREFLSLASAWI